MELTRVEGLDDVVVGAEQETHGPLVRIGTSGGHEQEGEIIAVCVVQVEEQL